MFVANKPLSLLFHEPGTVFPSDSASWHEVISDTPKYGWAWGLPIGGPNESQAGTQGLSKQVILSEESRIVPPTFN